MRNFIFPISNFQKGSILIQTLIGILIIGIAITVVTLSFPKANERQTLEKQALEVASVLEEARSRTLSFQDSRLYGVRIESSRVVLLPDFATTTLSSLVGIRNINLAGSTGTIYFQRLTGETLQSGTFELYLISSSTTYKTIRVSQSGNIDL